MSSPSGDANAVVQARRIALAEGNVVMTAGRHLHPVRAQVLLADHGLDLRPVLDSPRPRRATNLSALSSYSLREPRRNK